MNKILKLKKLTLKPHLVKLLLNLPFFGYLYDTGWIRSFLEQAPVDKNGKSLPWVTLPFINFIENRLNKSMDLFEFGSGNSTLYFSQKVKTVTSVEHDEEWIKRIEQQSKASNINVHLCHLEYDSEYCRFAQKIDKKFHLVIVDGRDRVNCIKQSISTLTEDGCIVLDDSERIQYLDGVNFIMESGFKKIDFWGMAPGLSYKKCTSVFYKNDNCLGI